MQVGYLHQFVCSILHLYIPNKLFYYVTGLCITSLSSHSRMKSTHSTCGHILCGHGYLTTLWTWTLCSTSNGMPRMSQWTPRKDPHGYILNCGPGIASGKSRYVQLNQFQISMILMVTKVIITRRCEDALSWALCWQDLTFFIWDWERVPNYGMYR